MIRNLNATSLKLAKFVVPVDTPCTGSASTQPMTPPTIARAIDSAMNAVTMRMRENPSARSVPISRVRYATAAYIVFIAPNIAPIDKMSVTNAPNTRMTVVIARDCSA